MTKLILGMLRALILGSLVCGFGNKHVLGQTFPTNSTVSQDGSGNFRTIGDAIKASPNNSPTRFYIKIKPGIYRETIFIGPEKIRLTLIGDGMDRTVIIGNKSNGTGIRTYDTATAGIKGGNFVAINMTFENDAGPENKQAVALRSEAESAFYKCSFRGYQDTLYAKAGRQFYKECNIYGTIDFIWGNAVAVFQNCQIFVRKPLPKQYNTITAQGRVNPTRVEGTVFHNCYFKATSDLGKYKTTIKTYLGRPYGTYSRVVIIKTYISDIVAPEGWVEWDTSTQGDKVYYAEYLNQGPGKGIAGKRINWPGVKILNNYKEASIFSVANFIKGNEWIPATGIPFTPDLV